MQRLSPATLADLPAGVRRPGYDRAALRAGIVHLGIGAFHRAHQAVMTEAALESPGEPLDWGIRAASLRSPDTRDALAPQAGLYTVAVPGGPEPLRIVGTVMEVLVAPEDPARLIAAMADPAVRVVTLTITEKGYLHDPAKGCLDEDHPDVHHDLAHPSRPRSAPGFLLAALARRRAAGVAPFTIVSCDNLPSNGRLLQRVLARMAAFRDPALGAHVADAVACPCTMVDRIVPATTDENRAEVAAALGARDAWPVITEPFSQWVIEDRFPTGRPAWERGGAQLVADVAPFELMKLRLLNGAHSALAYLGLLLGHDTIAEAVSDPRLSGFLAGLWAEVRPSVPPPPGVDLLAYTAALLARFRNPAIRHRLSQIAMDGSQKLPPRHLRVIEENLAAGRPIRHLALAVAAFLLHASGEDKEGRPTTVSDPLAGPLRERLAGVHHAPSAALDRVLGLNPLFGERLPTEPRVRAALGDALCALVVGGVSAALADLADVRA